MELQKSMLFSSSGSPVLVASGGQSSSLTRTRRKSK
jgi:hypothetical protein